MFTCASGLSSQETLIRTIMVSRELLGSLLESLETRAAHTPLSPREREGLEQLAVAVMASGEDEEIEISRDLLEVWRPSSE